MSEMSNEQRTLLAIALSMLVVVLWAKYFAPKMPPPPKSAPPVSAPAVTTAAPPTPARTTPRNAAAAQASEEKNIVIENPLYRVELSNRGGVVRSWKLKKYLDDQKPPKPLELVNSSSAQQIGLWPLSILLADSKIEAVANSGLYQIASSVAGADSGPASADATIAAPAEISFHWSDGHLDVAKRLKFDNDYQTGLEISATLDGKPLPVAVGWLGGFGDRAVYKAAQQVTIFYSENGKLNLLPIKKLGAAGHQEQRERLPGPVQYAGIEDQFFAAAFLPESLDLTLYHWKNDVQVSQPGSAQADTEPRAEVAAGTAITGPLKLRVFVGPKDLKVLGRLQPPLEGLVQFGWMGIIAKPMLEILNWIHRFVPNYGWAIIVFTLLITMALFPIRVWNYRSMKKMQKVAPEIRQIQDRYKKYSLRDPRKQKMNEEVMAVYQREGINPMGSCLPMLAQMPILFAFYRMLAGAIELRHAPWIGWIQDLSARDPYFILPIAMTLTMYFSQKMTPMTGVDPAQQRMMTLMPLFMGALFFTLSSGLNLYFFTSNLIVIAQQWYLNRTEPAPNRSKWKNKKE